MAQGLYVGGERATYTPRHFSPGAPRIKTKLICGKIVRVLEDEDQPPRTAGVRTTTHELLTDRAKGQRNSGNGAELVAPYHTQPTLNQYARLPPIETNRLDLRSEEPPAQIERLYHRLPEDGSLPSRRIELSDEEIRLLRRELGQYLSDGGVDRVMDMYQKLQTERKYSVPFEEVQEAMTRSMILIPPQLLKLAAALFLSGSKPGSVEIENFIRFLADCVGITPRPTPRDSWHKFPAELVPVLKMLPRHNSVPYESVLLKHNEREALLGHLRESLKDMEPNTLTEIYHELSGKDRDVTGCVGFFDIMDAFSNRPIGALIMPVILRLLASMYISRRHLGMVEYRAMLKLIEESLGTHFNPGPPALTLPPAPPRDLTHLLRLLPQRDQLPNESIMLRESDKAQLIKHIKSVMLPVTEEDVHNLHVDLSQYDRSMNGALRYQDLASVFINKKIEFSPEILRLIACMFISNKSPGHVDYKKFMLFLDAARKDGDLSFTSLTRESSNLAGIPQPPSTFLPLIRELPKESDHLPSEPLSLTKEERQELLAYLENHLYEFDPIVLEDMYASLAELDKDARYYIHFSIIREEIMKRKIPLHPLIVRLISAMCVAPNTESCVKYGQFLGFIGLGLKRMPRIPDLMDTPSSQPLNPEIVILAKRLPKHGLPDRALELSSQELQDVRQQLAGIVVGKVSPEQVMAMLDEFHSFDTMGNGVASLEIVKRIISRAKISIPERLTELIAALHVSSSHSGQVDFIEFICFIDSIVSESSTRRVFRGYGRLPEELYPLLKVVEESANLPYRPVVPTEYQRVHLNKYLSKVLADVSPEDLDRLYKELVLSDQYHEGAVPKSVIQTMLLKHRIPIHKEVVRILAAMFVQAKQMPNQVVDIKRLLMCMSSCLRDAAPIDGDLPQAHSPGIPALPAELLRVLRSLPEGDGLPNNPLVLSESEKACLQEHLVALSPHFSTESFKGLYVRMNDTDRHNTGSLSLSDIQTVLQQFGWNIPHDALKLTLAQFVADKSHGRVDYAKLVVFLNSTLNLASNKDMMDLTKLEPNPNIKTAAAQHSPEMESMVRLLPPYYQLPLEPLKLNDNEKEVLLDEIRRNVWPLDKNVLKTLYQQYATMDSRQLNYLPFEDVKHLLTVKGMNIDSILLRLICSQFVSTRMKGFVNYEDLINFMNEAFKSPKSLPATDEPIGLRVDLPQPLVKLTALLPERDPLPSAPLFLKDSERTMLAEAIHECLRQISEQTLTQLHAEYVHMDKNHARTLSYSDMLEGMIKCSVGLPIDVARLLFAQFIRDEGRVEYRSVIDFLKAAVKFIPELPPSMTGYESSRHLPPPRVHQGKIKPLHGREDIQLVRQIVRILTQNYFDPDMLRDAFTSADVRRNGTLSAVQIRDISKRHGAPLSDHIFDKIFEHLDYMGVGQFSWSQFVEFLQRCLDKGA